MQDDPEKIVEAIEKGFQKHKQDEECFDQKISGHDHYLTVGTKPHGKPNGVVREIKTIKFPQSQVSWTFETQFTDGCIVQNENAFVFINGAQKSTPLSACAFLPAFVVMIKW